MSDKNVKGIEHSAAAKLPWDALSRREFNTIETIITAMNYTRVERKPENTGEQHDEQ